MPDEHDDWYPLGGFETSKRGDPVDGGGYSGSGGWSASGTLATGAPDTVTLQAVFPQSDDYTVEFSFVPPIDSAGGDIIEAAFPVATIVWSVEGNSVRRQVNVVNGMSVTGVGQAVRIVISDETPGGTGESYQVSVQVAKGTRGSTRIQPFLVAESSADGTQAAPFFVGPGGPTFLDIAIPQDAGIQDVFITVAPVASFGPGGTPVSLVPGSILVWHVDSVSGNFYAQYDPTIFAGVWVPISPGADTIRLINNAPVLTGPNAQFMVYFGVDG